MPHDMNKTELQVGTLVLVPCYIKAVHLTEEYCNVDIEVLVTLFPLDTRQRLTMNSRQVLVKPEGFRLDKPHFPPLSLAELRRRAQQLERDALDTES